MKHRISMTSVNAALRAQDLLERRNFFVEIEKAADPAGDVGCLYELIFEGDSDVAVSILKESGINLLSSDLAP